MTCYIAILSVLQLLLYCGGVEPSACYLWCTLVLVQGYSHCCCLSMKKRVHSLQDLSLSQKEIRVSGCWVMIQEKTLLSTAGSELALYTSWLAVQQMLTPCPSQTHTCLVSFSAPWQVRRHCLPVLHVFISGHTEDHAVQHARLELPGT